MNIMKDYVRLRRNLLTVILYQLWKSRKAFQKEEKEES